jgi:hypothetical protein
MRRLVAFLAVAVALVVGVKVLMEATQNRPDTPAAGSSSTIEFTVSADNFQRGEAAAADALWAVCASTVDGDVSTRPQPVGPAWRVSISPALGEHGEKRLVGCLEDLTVDRAVGRVQSVHHAG